MRLRTTHTVVILAVSQATYEEIKQKLLAAGYDHAFINNRYEDEIMDMTGIGLTLDDEEEEYEPKSKYTP